MICLYVSPHLDDAAFSCAGGILDRRAAGQRVIVCTVFSRSGNRQRDAQRRGEDRRALEDAGVEALHLDFVDAPAREGIRPSFEALVLRARLDRTLVREVKHEIVSVIARVKPDEVHLPFGVGGHIDHRVVFAARPPSARFYVERPYAFVPALRSLCRLTQEADDRCPSPEQILREFDLRGCGGLLLANERQSCAKVLAARLRRGLAGRSQVRVRRHRYSASSLPAAVKMIDAYSSQVQWLFGARGAGSHYLRLTRMSTGWFEEEALIGNRFGR